MTATKKSTVPNTLVTVRITDTNGVAHTFHGNVLETVSLHTSSWEDSSGVRYNYIPARDNNADAGFEPATDWLRVYSATGAQFQPTIDAHGPDWFFSFHDFYVRIDSKNVDVRVATKEGRDWVQANLSLDARRAQMVAQVTALDPKLGETLDNLLSDVEYDAFDRGKDHEWHSVND